MIGDEAAGDVDTLLLAAGEGGGRQLPKLLRQVELGEQGASPLPGIRRRYAARQKRLGNDVDGGHAGHGAQELADIAERMAANLEHGARIGGGKIDDLVLLRYQDLAGVNGIVAVDHLQERALADAGWAAEHDAFAGCNREGDIGDDGQAYAVAQMHGEALEDFGNDEGVAMVFPQTCRIEETSSCV